MLIKYSTIKLVAYTGSALIKGMDEKTGAPD